MAYIILAIVSVAAIIMSLILPVKDYPQKEYKKDKLDFVDKYRSIIGVVNKGSSMDERTIYVVDYSELGFE